MQRRLLIRLPQKWMHADTPRNLDPEKKEEANVGLQLSYVAQTTQVITGGVLGGWWIMVLGPGPDGIIRILCPIPIIPIPW